MLSLFQVTMVYGGCLYNNDNWSIHTRNSSVQSLSCVRLFATPWIAACQASLSITDSRSLLKLMPIELVMPSSHLILCRPLLLLPPIPPSIRVFSNESTLHMRWPKDWSFSFSISPCNEHPGLISFRMDWLDLLALQGTLKSLLQHHSSKASIFLVLSFLHSPTLTSIQGTLRVCYIWVTALVSLNYIFCYNYGEMIYFCKKHVQVQHCILIVSPKCCK